MNFQETSVYQVTKIEVLLFLSIIYYLTAR